MVTGKERRLTMKEECPNCDGIDWEITERHYKSKKDGRIKATIICPDCGHEWTTSLWVGDDDGMTQ